jgi:hypothetical protein
VRGAEYFTIHITPEPHCSFVSFETNAQLASYNEVLTRVLAIFRPGQFSVSIFVDNASPMQSSQQAIDWEFDSFARDDCCYHEFTSQCNIAYANFSRTAPPPPTVHVVQVSDAACAALERCADDQKCTEQDEAAAASVHQLLASLGINAKQAKLVLPHADAAPTVVVLSSS